MLLMIRKTFLTLVFSALFASSAFASSFHYGAGSSMKTASFTNDSAGYATVVLRNFTYDTYRTYITFRPSGKNFIADVGRRYSGYDVITFNIDFPDSEVCFSVYRNFDGAQVYSGCRSYGEVWIGNPNNASFNAVTVK